MGRELVERRPAGLPPPLRLLQTGAAGVFSQQVPVPINVVRGPGVSPAGALSTFPPHPPADRPGPHGNYWPIPGPRVSSQLCHSGHAVPGMSPPLCEPVMLRAGVASCFRNGPDSTYLGVRTVWSAYCSVLSLPWRRQTCTRVTTAVCQ